MSPSRFPLFVFITALLSQFHYAHADGMSMSPFIAKPQDLILGDVVNGPSCPPGKACIDIHLSCYGTNLRHVANPISPWSKLDITISRPEPKGQVALARIEFPASMTWPDGYAASPDECKLALMKSLCMSKLPEHSNTGGCQRIYDKRYLLNDCKGKWECWKNSTRADIKKQVESLGEFIPKLEARCDKLSDLSKIECTPLTDLNSKAVPQVKGWNDTIKKGAKPVCTDDPHKITVQFDAKPEDLQNLRFWIAQKAGTGSGPSNPSLEEEFRYMAKTGFVGVIPGSEGVKGKYTGFPFQKCKKKKCVNSQAEGGEIAQGSAMSSFLAGPTAELRLAFPGQEGFCGGYHSPLMLFFGNSLPRFKGISDFMSPRSGVTTYWIEPGVKDAYFLGHLPKGPEELQSPDQLFGQDEIHSNGFETLLSKAKPGATEITEKDVIFEELVLWRDLNGNGIAEKEEIFRLKDLGITRIDLKYENTELLFGERARGMQISHFFYKPKGSKEEKRGDIIDIWFNALSKKDREKMTSGRNR